MNLNNNNFRQHVDFNVKPSNYNHLKDNELLITSIFFTIQGEGPFGGFPATFIRLAGCNLGAKDSEAGAGCEFCDTFFKFSEGKVMNFESILNEVNDKTQNRTRLIVITGGEPLLQKNVVGLVEVLNAANYNTQFETNSLLYRNIPKDQNGCNNHIICSPKMGASNKYPNLRPDVFERADCLKFVVEREGKFNYIPDYAFEFARLGKPVYVSPINVYMREVRRGEVPCFFTNGLYDLTACKDNYKYAAELSMKYGFILNLQKHLFLGLE